MTLLLWVQRVEAQGVQKEALDNIKEDKHFHSIIQNMQRQDSEMHRKQKQVEKYK